MEHTRHINLFDARNANVTLVGCGGIGAATAIVLAKMGVQSINLQDDDEVDQINLATQLHTIEAANKNLPKVEAVKNLIFQFSDDTYPVEKFGRVNNANDLLDAEYIISAVDSIAARKNIWQAVKDRKPSWYFDARMSAEIFHLYSVKMNDYEWYEKILAGEDDSNVPEVACTEKATIYCAFVAAGTIGSALKAAIIGEQPPRVLVNNMRSFTYMTLE